MRANSNENKSTDETSEEKIVEIPARRREMKGKIECPGCHVRFWKMDAELNVCHNCVKIH